MTTHCQIPPGQAHCYGFIANHCPSEQRLWRRPSVGGAATAQMFAATVVGRGRPLDRSDALAASARDIVFPSRWPLSFFPFLPLLSASLPLSKLDSDWNMTLTPADGRSSETRGLNDTSYRPKGPKGTKDRERPTAYLEVSYITHNHPQFPTGIMKET